MSELMRNLTFCRRLSARCVCSSLHNYALSGTFGSNLASFSALTHLYENCLIVVVVVVVILVNVASTL
jgi:hypothetical protein